MGEFISYLGFIFTKIYNLLDFKILGFPISCIHIILGTIVFAAFITFIKNISGIVTSSTGGFRDISGMRDKQRLFEYRQAMLEMRRRK